MGLTNQPDIATADGTAKINHALDYAVETGMIPAELGGIMKKQIPTDPSKNAEFLQQMQVQRMSAKDQFDAQYGQTQMVNNGNKLIPTRVSPLGGQQQIGAPIQMQATPEDLMKPVQVINPQTNQAEMIPQAEANRRMGINNAGQLQDQVIENPDGSGGGSSGAPPVQSSHSMPLGPSAGDLSASTSVGTKSGEDYATALTREGNFSQEMVPLTKARDALIKLGPGETGPLTDKFNELKSFAQTLPIVKGLVDPNTIQNYDEAKKYLVQYAMATGASPGTNDKLAAAFSGNASTDISNAAAVDVVKTNIALRRLQNAQVTAFNQAKQQNPSLSPSQYSQWLVKFNNDQDPVAYGFDQMEPAQRKSYFKSLKTPEAQNKFLASLKTAQDLNLLSPPQEQ